MKEFKFPFPDFSKAQIGDKVIAPTINCNVGEIIEIRETTIIVALPDRHMFYIDGRYLEDAPAPACFYADAEGNPCIERPMDKHVENNIRCCTACKWCVIERDYACNNPDATQQTLEYLVTGYSDNDDCYNVRKNICGIEGKYWEAK